MPRRWVMQPWTRQSLSRALRELRPPLRQVEPFPRAEAVMAPALPLRLGQVVGEQVRPEVAERPVLPALREAWAQPQVPRKSPPPVRRP